MPNDLYSKLFGQTGNGAIVPKGHAADHDDDYIDIEALADDNTYAVRQTKGYLSILFSIVQIVVLLLMILPREDDGGGLAPWNVNPMIGPYPDTLDDWGAKNTEKIVHEKEWWRIFPCPVFLHAGLLHLMGNVAVQLNVGALWEREWGSLVWFMIYSGGGIGSSICSVYFMPDSIGVGSSGAICGLFGAKLSEVVCRYCERKRSVQDRVGHEIRSVQFKQVIFNVIVIGLFSFVPFVDWAAHLGGFISGIAIGMVFFSCMIENKLVMLVGCSLGVFLTMTLFLLGIQSIDGEPN